MICSCLDKWTTVPVKSLKIFPYQKYIKKRPRAGVFLFCADENKLLVVEVYNQYIGLPKGGQENNETLEQTAIRETYEETGINLDLEVLKKAKLVTIHPNYNYYVIFVSKCIPVILKPGKTIDVSGAGWIHLNCLHNLKGIITANLKIMIRKILQKNL
jgi:8-oxo-dGTP pyrophosphatase MutT (NUDIX family)